jgi:hypothetical protein
LSQSGNTCSALMLAPAPQKQHRLRTLPPLALGTDADRSGRFGNVRTLDLGTCRG